MKSDSPAPGYEAWETRFEKSISLFCAGDQLLKGGNTSARAAFAELIEKYPKSDLVPEALCYTAQEYAAERQCPAPELACTRHGEYG